MMRGRGGVGKGTHNIDFDNLLCAELAHVNIQEKNGGLSSYFESLRGKMGKNFT